MTIYLPELYGLAFLCVPEYDIIISPKTENWNISVKVKISSKKSKKAVFSHAE